ncbi:helix-turn-helix transcriptional regulator [Nocardia amamiensis]|uniref:helix-turn-helix transcriptional regulator n=1 Tax=Nocardia amamiensis TaxID=404578 RepID=UPI00082E31AB|nr:helix-turn-helix transcriptional regulator [Nocardia amamiensis]
MVEIGSIIRDRRNALGLGQAELGERVGVTERQVGRWESGSQEPAATSCLHLAHALNLSLEQLFGVVPIGLDLSGQWFAAWDTTRDRKPVIDRHTITAQHRGASFTFAADGDYLWTGDLRVVDGSLMGTYLATERDHLYRGSLYFMLGPESDAGLGRWSGLWADGLVGGGWGVLARDEDRAGRLMDSVMAHEGPLTEWPRED